MTSLRLECPLKFLFLLISLRGIYAGNRSCPCLDERNCELITKHVDKEVVVFSTRPNVWIHYDWSAVTTVAVFGYWDDELMCYAHSKGVKVVIVAFFDVADLFNATKRKKWVYHLTKTAFARYADGVNIDIEGPVREGSKEVSLLSELTSDVYEAFKESIPGSQVSFDVAWSPDCIDGRCYDVVALSKSVDFLFVMAYDEMSQIFGPVCAANANSAFSRTKSGLSQYLDLGIEANQLVLGLPWYGYDYICVEISGADTCHLKRVPFRGANCSDAAGRQIPYSYVNDLLVSRSEEGRKWDEESRSPYFDYYDAINQRHQVWYDDPESLALKIDYAKQIGLKGAGVWNADQLDYGHLQRSLNQTKKMWNALSFN